MSKIGVYAGTFDPITDGHLNVITRAQRVVNNLIIAVAEDTGKQTIFNCTKRLQLVEDVIRPMPALSTVKAACFSGLLVDFCLQVGATIIIRGLRAASDFEYEYQLSCLNTKLAPSIETVFLPASGATQYISSRYVKEVARLGGNVAPFVPVLVERELRDYYSQKG